MIKLVSCITCQSKEACDGHKYTYLTDSATLLTEDLLGVCSADDDVRDGGGDADLDTRVTLLSELTLEELVELGVENTVGDELSALGDVEAAHGLSGGGLRLHIGLLLGEVSVERSAMGSRLFSAEQARCCHQCSVF